MENLNISIEDIMQKASSAAGIFSQLDQRQTDRIVESVYRAAFKNRVKLAKMAVEETGIGKWKDKTIKNVLASQFVYNDIKNMKTVGIISKNETSGITEIAAPIGPIFAAIPVTNPTSTVIFKILIALKTRNPIIIRPHERANKCSCEAARICYEAALKVDAPEHCIQWVTNTSREQTQEIMSHKKTSLILATGGSGLVKAAYSSGKPAFGVGAGNVPVFIEKSADIPFAVKQIIMSKTFDNGTVCASEQAIIVEKESEKVVKKEMLENKCYFLNDEEIEKVTNIAFDKEKKLMKAEVVGQSVKTIADMAGIKIPDDIVLLVAPLKGVGRDYPLSSEILAPIIAFYTALDFNQAVNLCLDLNFFGGTGHTVSLFSNDRAKTDEFSGLVNAGRIVINTPSAQGAVGGLFNTLHPSLTLGCGTGGNNITTDNITATHLLNIQRVARRRVNSRLEKFDTSLYLDEKLDHDDIEKIFNKNF